MLPWYSYVAAFFSGAFLANVVPHLVHGVSGDPFPTPFAKPPGKGLSSPTVNVLWALLNLIIGYLLARAAHLSTDSLPLLAVFFAGITALSVQLSMHFVHKAQ
jgi:hypothetical protein